MATRKTHAKPDASRAQVSRHLHAKKPAKKIKMRGQANDVRRVEHARINARAKIKPKPLPDDTFWKKGLNHAYPWSQQAENEILHRVSQGESMRSICSDDHMPGYNAIMRRVNETSGFGTKNAAGNADFAESFGARFARAKKMGMQAMLIECLQIANTPCAGEIEIEREQDDGTITREYRREDMLGHRKLRIETYMKVLAKMDPATYGERITQEHTGAQGTPLMIDPVRLSGLNDEELAQILQGLEKLKPPDPAR